MIDAPGWLEAEVAEGLAALHVLRLPNTPAADQINKVVDVWLVALMEAHHGWDATQDAALIRKAFRRLCAACERWPAPKQLLDALPPRPSPPMLPAPPVSEAKRKAAIAHLQGLMAMLNGTNETRNEP